MSAQPMSFSLEEVSDRQTLTQYKSEWDTLARESRAGGLFHTHNWIAAWIDAFWHDNPLTFIFVRDDADRLIGCVPLLHDQRGDLWCRGSLVSPGNDHAMRTDILAADECERVALPVLEYLRQTRPGSRVVFRLASSDSWVANEFPRLLAELNMHSVVIPRFAQSPYVDLDCGKDEYYRTRSSHFRHEMRRKQRRIEKAGRVKRLTVTSEGDLERAWNDVVHIEKSSWKHEAGSAWTSHEALSHFYQGFANRSASDTSLRLHLLYLDEVPIAYVFGAVFKSIYYAIATSYHVDYRNQSPGVVVIGYALDDSFEQGFDRIDLLGVESRWKKDLATGCHSQVDVCAFVKNRIRCEVCRHIQQTAKPFLRQHAPVLVRMKHALSRK